MLLLNLRLNMNETVHSVGNNFPHTKKANTLKVKNFNSFFYLLIYVRITISSFTQPKNINSSVFPKEKEKEGKKEE